ncbi:neurosecretory protein VGF-like [Pristis pectinata]|uniref:neurosecretory protein VGF-like n=1 Tax=Pristis pectinata TaxID=685728 RepID=UPI00223D2C0D|nr:neurosecretory protein VGF-like [Pristis pectinata]
MIWPARSPTLLIFTLALLCPNSVGGAPLTLDGHEEQSRQVKAKESGQIAHSQQDPNMSTEDTRAPQGQMETAKTYQVRSVAASHPGAPRDPGYDEDLFKDMDAKALATILLQALKVDGEKTEPEESKRRSGAGLFSVYQGSPEEDREDTDENVKSRTRVAKTQRRDHSESRESDENNEGTLAPRNLGKLESMLQDLERYSAATKRERSSTNQQTPAHHGAKSEESKENDVLRELDAFEELVERKQGYSDYEESAEDGKGRTRYRGEDLGGQEVGRKNLEEDQANDMASELLLQYLLKGETSQEEEPHQEEEAKKSGAESGQEVDSASEEKRSDEEDGEDIDPQTIDRLIEISSKLHLPADDVIDIINDVEKKRKDSMERAESRHGGSRRKYRPDLREDNLVPRYREDKLRHRSNNDLTLQDLLSAENALDYGGMSLPVPRRYRPGQNTYPNYIRPRTYQQRHRPYYYQPVFRNGDYYDDDSQDKEEELENYIEKILLKHPEVFQ